MSNDILDLMDEPELDEFEESEDDGFDAALEAVSAELVTMDEGGDLTEARAREVTEAIRSAATATFVLLSWAHEHNAHKALGYATWAEYVQTEFDMSAQRSYQLLDLSKVTHEIESAVPDGTEVKLTEAQARDIKRELPLVTEKIREAVGGGEAPEEAVDRVVQEIREQKKADEKAAEAKEKAEAKAREEGRQAGLEAAADALLEADRPDGVTDRADADLIEVTVQGDDDNLSPEDSMNLYNFFNVLSGLSSLPEPDDFLATIPKARAAEIEHQLLNAVSWLNRFQTLWELEQGE